MTGRCCCGKYDVEHDMAFAQNDTVHELSWLEGGPEDNFCGPLVSHERRDLQRLVRESDLEIERLKGELRDCCVNRPTDQRSYEMTKGPKFGVVGSRRWKSQSSVEGFVRTLLPGDTVVSGGCRGPDLWATNMAKRMGLKTVIFLPQFDDATDRWEIAKAYYARNRLIAEASDVVVAFVAADRTGGTENTLKHAEEIGVPALICTVGHTVSREQALEVELVPHS